MQEERSVRYIVKPEDKIVVCIIKEDWYEQYRGVAKCSPDDKFDEEKGKRIAYLRACEKRKRGYIQMAKCQMKNCENELDYYTSVKTRIQGRLDSMRKSLASYREELDTLCK